MQSLAAQGSLILEHASAIGAFAKHLHDVLRFFLSPSPSKAEPTRREAAQAVAIMEPVAKDGGSQLFVTAGRDVTIHMNGYNSQEANAIQNSARRMLGPRIPSSQIYHDELLTLHQVRGDASATVGDKGVIESIAPYPAKLLFASEEIKAKVTEQPSNPFKKLFLVDVEARATESKVRLYRVLAVKDVLDRD